MPVQIIKKKCVVQAIEALRKSNENFFKDSSKKKPLLFSENESPMYLNIQLKKIPKLKSMKMIKVQLPHRLLKETSDICLIAGDLNKRDPKAEIEPDIVHYKELLEKHEINCISEVVTLRQLRTEYKPYEAKQKLLAAYDRFLNDNRITECLPKVLGRHFFKNKKFPIQIQLKTANLKQQVEKALSTLIFYVTGHGNTCSAQVAYLDMDDSEIIENVTAVVDALSKQLPGSWDNVMGVYLKTARSKAIPIYVSYDDPNKVEIESEVEDDSYEIDELSSIPNVNVKVHKNGRVETLRIKEESKSDNVKSENEDSSEDTQNSMDETKKKKKSNAELFKLEKDQSELAGQSKKRERKKKQAPVNSSARVEDFEEDTQSSTGVTKKKKKSDPELFTLEKDQSELAGQSKNRERKKKQAPVNSFACVEDSRNDTHNNVNVMEKKSKRKQKLCQELFTFENDISDLAVQNNKSKKSNKEKDSKNNIQTSVDTKEKKKKSDSDLFTFKKKLSESAVQIKKSKMNRQQTSMNSFTCVQDSEEDTENSTGVTKKKKKFDPELLTLEKDQSELGGQSKKRERKKKQAQMNSFACVEESKNDKQNNVNVIEKKSKKKEKSCQELFTLENGTSELFVQNNKIEVEGKKLKSALKRQRERSLLMGEKTESSSPAMKKKKIEDVQTKKLNRFKENIKGKKKKGNHL